MNIISELQINAFRGIYNLDISNLSTVNVLVGANNCGKTSVLEAIKLISDPYNYGAATNLAFSRIPSAQKGNSEKIVEAISTLYKKEIEEEKTHYLIDIAASIQLGKIRYTSNGQIEDIYTSTGVKKRSFLVSVKTQIGNDKPFYSDLKLINGQEDELSKISAPLISDIYIPSSVNYYRSCVSFLSDSIISERKKELIGLLRGFDQNIEDISIINETVYIHNSVSGTLPLYTYGTGMQKAVMLSGILSLIKNGVILIDEIDNALNISAFGEVFPWFVHSCKEQNVQAFITTHSAEAIDAILDTVRPDDDDIRIITLRKLQKSHDTVAKVRTGAEALTDRNNFKMELRV